MAALQDLFMAVESNRPLDEIVDLANVERPPVATKSLHDRWVYSGRTVRTCLRLEKPREQIRDLFDAGSQRQQLDPQPVEPCHQVGSKSLLLDEGGEGGLSGDDNADVDGNWLRFSE